MNGAPVAAVAVALVLPPVLGHCALRAAGLRPGAIGLAWTGWALATGLLIYATVCAAFLALGVPAAHAAAAACCAAAAIGSAAVLRRRAVPADAPAIAPAARDFRRAERILFSAATAIVLLGVVDRAVLARGAPVAEEDELFIWDVRGKAIAAAGALDARYAAAVLESQPTPAGPHRRIRQGHYPLLLPVLTSAMHAAADGDAGVDARWPVVLANVALALALAGALRARLRPAAAAGWLLAAAGARASAFDGGVMADGCVALGLLVGLDAVDRARRGGGRGFALPAVVGVGLAAFAKQEGTAAAVGIALGAFFARGPTPRAATALAALAYAALNGALNARLGLTSAQFPESAPMAAILENAWRLRAERPAAVLSLLWHELLCDPRLSGGVPAAAVALAALRPRPGGDRGPFGLALAAAVAAPLLVYLGTQHDLRWHWDLSAARICGQWLPAAAAWGAASAAATLPGLRATGADGDGGAA